MELRQYDKAWCVAAALRRSCARPTPRSSSSTSSTSPRASCAPRRASPRTCGRTSTTPTRTATSRAVFAAVSQSVAAARAKEHKDWGLKRKDKRDVANDQLLFSKVFNYVNQVLGVPQPELYLRPESPGELDLANAREKAHLMPSFVVCSGLLQGRPEKELAYVIAQAADVHAARSLRALAARRADGRRAEDRLPGGAEAGAAEVRGEGGRAAGRGAVPAAPASARWRRSRSSSWPPSSSASSPTRARPTSTSGRTRST